MVMISTSRIESGFTHRAAVAAFEVFIHRQLVSAHTAQNRLLIPLTLRPHLDRMVCQRDVAILTGVVIAAAFHLDSDDV